jgi:hypothetical protein
VGHEEQPLPCVGRADARSAQIRRPDGVTASLQVSENNVEPPEAILARNLLSKEDWRATLLDECEPCWPKMSRVENSAPLARIAERLAGARSGPDVGVIGDPCESQRGGPSADPSEEVPLSRPCNVCCGEVVDGSAIDSSGGDVVMGDETLQPVGDEGVVIVVECEGHENGGSLAGEMPPAACLAQIRDLRWLALQRLGARHERPLVVAHELALLSG